MKKILLTLLSIVCVFFCSLGIIACGEDEEVKDDRDPQIVEAYNKYVAFAESLEVTPVNYQVWLRSIRGLDGIGITDTKIEDGKLYIKYSDSSDYVELGQVKGIDGIGITDTKIEDGKLYIKYSNSDSYVELGQVKGIDGQDGEDGEDGADGADGRGVVSATINSDKELVLTYSDGTTQNIGKITFTDHVHEYGEPEVKSATCTEDGFVKVTCSSCGDVDVYAIPSKGHCYDAWGETIPATCLQEGQKSHKCIYCGNVETETIEKHDHVYNETYVYNGATHWQYCITCGVKYNEQNHTKGEATCPICGYKIPEETQQGESEGMIYALRDDGESYALVDMGSCKDTDISVLSTYNGKPVTEIESVFSGVTTLTSVSVPNSVTKIPAGTFKGCTELTSVVLSTNLESIPSEMFYGCTKLASVEIPNSVTSIGDWAFYNCDSLISVTIPDSITSIGDNAFYNCDSLMSVTIGNGVTSIGGYAFRDCDSLISVAIGNSVTSIGSYAFYYCSSLTSIVIPENVNYIFDRAFSSCNKLTNVVFKNTKNWYVSGTYLYSEILSNSETACRYLTSNYAGSNWYCSKLDFTLNEDKESYSVVLANRSYYKGTSIEIPATFNGKPVTSIGYQAFRDCRSLTSIEIPDGVTSIGDEVFYGCDSLTSVKIGNGVTSIGYQAFRDCSSLISVKIGNGVTSIGSSAFRDCRSLTSIEIPDCVTSIGSYAFYDCDSLTSVTIGNGVTSIGNYAFYYCSSLTSVYYKGTSEDWDKISIGSFNSPLTNAKKYYYSEVKPQTTGNYWHYDTDGKTILEW